MSVTFFNAYIQNISVSLSWGSGASCQLSLVEDPDNGYELNAPPIGSPVGLNIGQFYFGGIYQRGSYKESVSGRTFEVVIEAPNKYLDGIQIILSDFNGQLYNDATKYSPGTGPTFLGSTLVNVWNPFAHRENYKYGGIYGGSNINSNGFPVLDALQLIELISRGESIFGGPATFGGFLYYVNLGSLIGALSGSNYRLQGPVQNLTSIIDECAELAGLEYYSEVQGDGLDSQNVIINPYLNIRTISRGYQPNPGAVTELINNADSQGNLISRNVGHEWSVPTTQKLVLGGKGSRLLIQGIETTVPVWGKQQNNMFVYSSDPTLNVYQTPGYTVPVYLDKFDASQIYFASIFELRMASGSRETWESWKTFETLFGVERNGYNNFASAPWYGKIKISTEYLVKILNQPTFQSVSADWEQTGWDYITKRISGALNEQSDKIWSAVSEVANNFYGQSFLMQIKTYEPGGISNNLKWIQDDVQVEHAWEIADSAWVETPLFADLNFYDGEGRTKGGCAWPSNPNMDFSSLGSDWAFTLDGGIATFKGGPEKDIYWIDNLPYVIVNSGGQVKYYDALTTPDFGLSVMFWMFTGIWLNPAVYLSGAAGQNVQIAIPPAVVPPTSFGVPQESNRYVWGPWYAWRGGNPGKTDVVFDESLRPEVFGSAALLDQAAFSKAATGLAQASINETGSVELAGLPDYNLANQFGGGGPYINGMNISIGVGGITTTYQFQNWTPKFGQLSQTNIERIKQVRKGMLAFAQNKRSQIVRKPLPQIQQRSRFDELTEKYSRISTTMVSVGFGASIDANLLQGQTPGNLPSRTNQPPPQ